MALLPPETAQEKRVCLSVLAGGGAGDGAQKLEAALQSASVASALCGEVGAALTVSVVCCRGERRRNRRWRWL